MRKSCGFVAKDGESRSPLEGVLSCILTFDATNVPLDGHSKSVPSDGAAVKYGKLPFPFIHQEA
ncbi:MAG: hypothetical protein KRP56_01685 [Candidatus Methanogranum gryphiswaldense]|nr:MAG: hypothetical protein KRP56_01685 [Candidatus Methanogranum sp. U3.2.1]